MKFKRILFGPFVTMHPLTCYFDMIWGQARGLLNSTYNYIGIEFKGLRVPDVRIMQWGFLLDSLWNPTLGSRHNMLIFMSDPL